MVADHQGRRHQTGVISFALMTASGQLLPPKKTFALKAGFSRNRSPNTSDRLYNCLNNGGGKAGGLPVSRHTSNCSAIVKGSSTSINQFMSPISVEIIGWGNFF
jgi:hypothetical protein